MGLCVSQSREQPSSNTEEKFKKSSASLPAPSLVDDEQETEQRIIRRLSISETTDINIGFSGLCKSKNVDRNQEGMKKEKNEANKEAVGETKGYAAESLLDSVLTRATRENEVIEMDFEKDLKLIKFIDEGSFRKVYKARWDKQVVAVKIFKNLAAETVSDDIMVTTTHNSRHDRGQSDGTQGLAVEDVNITTVDDARYKELYGEIILAPSITPHPNIVRIIGYCRKPLCTVMEFMPGGSVQKLVYGLTNKPTPSVREKLIILIKACSGLKKLNEHNLRHRDVAARNILLGEYDEIIDRNTSVKITGFGMTRKYDECYESQKTVDEHGPFKWMAPESIMSQKYNEKTDVYMFGITMWEIMFGQAPYQDLDDINVAMSVCMEDERPYFLWMLPNGLKELIQECWSKKADDRPTFKHVAERLECIMNELQIKMQKIKEMDSNGLFEGDGMRYKSAQNKCMPKNKLYTSIL